VFLHTAPSPVLLRNFHPIAKRVCIYKSLIIGCEIWAFPLLIFTLKTRDMTQTFNFGCHDCHANHGATLRYCGGPCQTVDPSRRRLAAPILEMSSGEKMCRTSTNESPHAETAHRMSSSPHAPEAAAPTSNEGSLLMLVHVIE
jgi:hypothetical protein